VRNQLRPALGLLGIGWYFVTSIVLGVLGGLWLDNELNAEPLFVLLGLVLGLTAAAWGTYRLLRDVLREGRGS
jgi:ATP synthase protein I